MEEKEIKNLIENLNKKARQSSRKCLFKGCHEPAIESHLLQRRGIINQIAENNHVWELGQDNFNTDVFFFKNIGVKEAFSFFGFCSTHDNALFKEIENSSIDYTDYRTQLLFSYRAIMNEMRKKEILIDYYDRILRSFTLGLYVSKSYFEYIRESKQGLQDGIKDEFYFEDYFLSNINDPTKRDFKFTTFELPRTEICSSAVFTYETTAEINHMLMFESYKEEKPLTEIYFNFLPTIDKSIIIMGCLNERVDLCWNYIESFNSKSPNESLKKVSDLLLCQVENWLCSNTLYQTKIKAKEKEIIKITHESIIHPNERRVLDFDMFSNE